MIFWTTWMFAVITGAVCLGVAMERPDALRRYFWLGCSYFSMASGVIATALGVPL